MKSSQQKIKTIMASTIFSVATGRVSACGVSIIRVSGAKAHECISKMTGSSFNGGNIVPRTLKLTNIHDPCNPSRVLDRGLVAFFPAPRSFTGEDIVEYVYQSSDIYIRF